MKFNAHTNNLIKNVDELYNVKLLKQRLKILKPTSFSQKVSTMFAVIT